MRYTEAEDGLPTAIVSVAGEQRCVKLDSGARFTVAGTEWMQFGDKVQCESPVDYVEGIGGFLLDVVGVWSFKMSSIFGETIYVQACVVDGCTTEFLLGVDFMREHGATMDFSSNELKYKEGNRTVIIPFRTFDQEMGARVAAVRMMRKTRLGRGTITPVEVAVTASDGEQGIFLPTTKMGSVLLSATVTVARGGKALVPAINTGKDRVKRLSFRTWPSDLIKYPS